MYTTEHDEDAKVMTDKQQPPAVPERVSGDCLNRAFAAGLRYCGLPVKGLPTMTESDHLKTVAESYGLTFLWKGAKIQAGNHPVLVAYRDESDSTDGEYHAVFASDQAPFTRWPVHSAVVGWDELAARVHQTDEARVGARRVNITLGYIKRAAGKKLPELPCRVDEMTERKLAIFKIGAEAVGTLQFIAREIEALETRGDLLPQLSSSEIARRIQEQAVEIRKAGNDSGNERNQQFIEGGISALGVLADDIEDGTFPVSSSERGNEQRHPRMTPEDHRRIQETLDSLPEYPTEEEAESYLQACGTSGKEVVNQFIERLLKERLGFKEEAERLRVLLSSSERRCGECGHGYSTFDKFLQRCNVIIDGASICGCKCVFPATGTTESEQQLTEVAAQAYVDGFDAATAPATTHEGPQSNLERHAYQEHPLYPNYCAFAVGSEDYCKREPDSEVHLSDDVDQHGRRIPFVAPGHAWERRHGIECVECPDCCFTFAAMHGDGDGSGYSCPNCGTGETAPAGAESGAVAWLLPQIKHRLQTVLDCENGMCTHCCEVLAGDLAPMIDRAIELCATPTPVESGEAEPLNGSEDSWMTL